MWSLECQPGHGAAFVALGSRHVTLLPLREQIATRRHLARPALKGTWASLLVCSGTAFLAVASLRLHRRHARLARRSTRVQRRGATIEAPVDVDDDEDTFERDDIRNIAIIAHVDHGKTTLTDALMKQTGMKEVKSMDSDAIEQERGITILAKNAAIRYKGIKINIIDTPGHADFGGEVERILNMADGCLLLVDAQEGPMPQTKFVLRKALELKRRVLVCINKVDKPASRPDWVLDTTFDLFAALGADDHLCDFPVCYASGIQGKASVDAPEALEADLIPLIDQIITEVPKPRVKQHAPLQMLVANLDYDDYVGRICIGRLTSGNLKIGQEVGFQYGPEGPIRKSKVSKLWEFQNNEKVEVKEVTAGDICAFAGMDDVSIGDTVVEPSEPNALPPIMVQEPTVAMEFGINRSPLAGKDDQVKLRTGSELERRLTKECMTNLALRLEPGSNSDSFKVKGRGTLQLSILIENMRREGFEIMVSAPEVIEKTDPETGARQEPYEDVAVEVPTEHQGFVMEEFQRRGALMDAMEPGALEGSLVFRFKMPTANLIGVQGKLAQSTKGTGVMTSQFSHYGDMQKQLKLREKGVVVNVGSGVATPYAMSKVQNRGTFWVNPQDEVYEGMVIGFNNQDKVLEVNIAKEKQQQLTRTVAKDDDPLKAVIPMSLEDFMEQMDTDEVLEVTPSSLRLVKKTSKALKK